MGRRTHHSRQTETLTRRLARRYVPVGLGTLAVAAALLAQTAPNPDLSAVGILGVAFLAVFCLELTARRAVGALLGPRDSPGRRD